MADGNGTTKDVDATKALYRALVKAQAKARGVEKDSRNKHGGYNYASAEAIIADTKPLLTEEGLGVIPLGTAIAEVPVEREGTTKEGKVINLGSVGKLRASFLLVHVDGGSLQLEREWPIVCEIGRPMDKATAAADTASLGYFLRDLLLLPRVEEGTDLDHDSRDEHRANAGPSEADLRKAIGAELDRLGEKTADARTARVTAIYGRTPKTLSELQAILDNLKTQPAPKG